jgi:hypothetical protein
MRKGWSVFRALSPCSPCDLVIVRGAEMYRVEVTKGYFNARGTYSWPTHDPSRYDVLALWLASGDIAYPNGCPIPNQGVQSAGDPVALQIRAS